ncbi:glycosyltransferase [Echinicola marina]|uniref:glycosyltransferase n=1 Tax=Echinicola marina TaxID=2859768 RepID=UPI001CF66D25|nr:glycosyltransferase [Echinicola marina]UCS92958.1 glycosyltransferase [Echinicola marina]
MKKKITVLFPNKKITLMYSFYPFWNSKFMNHFVFTNDIDWVLRKDRNEALLIVGKILGQNNVEQHIKLFKALRNKYKVISFFDDYDGSESQFLFLLPYLDIYYKKQLFSDRNRYLDEFYGRRIFSDFYHKQMGVIETPLPKELPKLEDKTQLKKMRVSWNLGIGQYPASKIKVFLGKKLYSFFGANAMRHIHSQFPFSKNVPKPQLAKCQARFGYKGYRTTVGYQRKLFSNIVDGQPAFLSGLIPLKEYNKEIKNVQAILSPFGWGEICFRDFEAIRNGAVMVKPTMDHIETWPNIYQPNKTYVPISWDGNNLLETVNKLLEDSKRMNEIREYAWEELKTSYEQVDSRVEKILLEIHSMM